MGSGEPVLISREIETGQWYKVKVLRWMELNSPFV